MPCLFQIALFEERRNRRVLSDRYLGRIRFAAEGA